MNNNPSISVFGLGYVGSVTAACLAKRGFQVVGCDISQAKTDQINSGVAPISEPGLDELISQQHEVGRIHATTDAASAIKASTISFICVGTPSTASGALDLRFVEGVSQQIADAIKEKKERHAIVFRSTMLPGSTRQLAERFFSEVSHLVDVFFYPEFLRQGAALADFEDPSLSAIGVLEVSQKTDSITGVLEKDTEVVLVESAELLKYSCNAFHAAKVAFANEIGRIGKAVGLDSSKVMHLLCQDDRLNISSYYLRPGTPFGGSCLPKDVSALCQKARSMGVAVPMLDSLLESNQRHLESLIERVEFSKTRRVLLVGLAFKAGTDDLRGSAMLELAASLLLRDFDVKIFDPDVAPRNLVGANQRFAAAKLPSLDSLLVSDLAVALKGERTTLVISKPCVEIVELKKLLGGDEEHHVIDVNGWADLKSIAPSYEGLCW